MSIHNGVAQRPTAFAQLLIDSLDRYRTSAPPTDASGIYVMPSTSSAWNLQLGGNALNGYFTRIGVTQINFQWNLPNIIAGYNNAFSIRYSSTGVAPYTDLQITLGQGFYTPATLAAEIDSQLTTETGSPWVVSYNDGGYFDIQAPAGWAFIMKPPANSNAIDALIERRCRETLGFSNYPLPTDAPANRFTFGVPSMLATRFIDIVSDTLTKYSRAADNTSLPSSRTTGVICRVYPAMVNQVIPIAATSCVGDSPFNVFIDFNNPKFMSWNPDEAIANVDFKLYDDLGFLLPPTVPNQTTGGSITGFNSWFPSCEYQLTLYATET
jgi:hypothetical protein